MEATELQHSSVLLISTRLILHLRHKLFFLYARRGWENMWWFYCIGTIEVENAHIKQKPYASLIWIYSTIY